MKTELRIEMCEPNVTNYTLYRRTDPPGVEVGPLRGEVRASFDLPTAKVLFLVITYDMVKPAVQGFVKDVLRDVAKDAAKKWTVEFITNLKAARMRINNREPKDASEVERIIIEEIDVGKND